LRFISSEAERVAFLLGVNAGDLLKALLKPKIKVGTEVVTQGRNKDQVGITGNSDSYKYQSSFKNLRVAELFFS
jgi:myosin heavy subunit